MFFRFIYVWALWLLLISNASAGSWVMHTNLNLIGQSPWVWKDVTELGSWPEGAFQATATTNITATVNLTNTLAAGTYRVFVKNFQYFTTSTGAVQIAMGGVTNELKYNTASQYWSTGRVMVTTTSATNILFTFTKPDVAAQVVNFFGVYVTTNAQEGFPGNDEIVFDHTPIAETTNYYAGNLFENSSFETSLFPWSFVDDGDQGHNWQYNDVVVADATAPHGLRSLKFHSALAGNLFSRAFRIRTTARHTFSFYAKNAAGGNVSCQIVRLDGAAPNFPAVTNHTWTSGTALSSSWVRHSTNLLLNAYPTPYYVMLITGPASTFIDAIDLQEGTVTNAYAPQADVEMTLHSTRQGSLYYNTNQLTLPAVTFNSSGSIVNTTLRWELFDVDNRLVKTGTDAVAVGAGAAVTNWIDFSVSGATNGYKRIMARLDAHPIHVAEWELTVIRPIPDNIEATNSPWGTHQMYGTATNNAFLVDAGYEWSRTLSPGLEFRPSVINPSDGVFSWTATDARINNATNGGLRILGSLSTGGAFPSWMLTNGFPRGDKYSNYVFQLVNRYKDRIHDWESHNEPLQAYGFEQTNFYAMLLTMEAGAVKAADPTANFVGFGGLSHQVFASRADTNVWTLLDANTKSQIDAISYHPYPDTMESMLSLGGQTVRSRDIVKAWGGIKPVWNTEWGVVSKQGWHSRNYLHHHMGQNWYGPERDRAFVQNHEYRTIQFIQRALETCDGWTRAFQYDARYKPYNSYDLTHFSTIDFTDAFNIRGSLQATLQSILPTPVMHGLFTNSASVVLVFHLWTQGSSNIVTMYNCDAVLRNLSVTNTGFTLYDWSGNPVTWSNSWFQVNRRPLYAISTTLTTNQIRDTFKFASVTNNAADQIAPYVSIDDSPHGLVGLKHFPLICKWWAGDNLWWNSLAMPTNVVYRRKLVGRDSDFTGWGEESYMEIASLPSGTYNLVVEAKDLSGNISSATGPEFTVSIPTTPNRVQTGIFKTQGTSISQ